MNSSETPGHAIIVLWSLPNQPRATTRDSQAKNPLKFPSKIDDWPINALRYSNFKFIKNLLEKFNFSFEVKVPRDFFLFNLDNMFVYWTYVIRFLGVEEGLCVSNQSIVIDNIVKNKRKSIIPNIYFKMFFYPFFVVKKMTQLFLDKKVH